MKQTKEELLIILNAYKHLEKHMIKADDLDQAYELLETFSINVPQVTKIRAINTFVITNYQEIQDVINMMESPDPTPNPTPIPAPSTTPKIRKTNKPKSKKNRKNAKNT